MKHIKPVRAWLAESEGIARLIELGLVDPGVHQRFYFEINTGKLGALWKRLRAGYDEPYPETLDQGGQLRLGWTWIVPRDYDEHNFYETGFHVSTGRAVELDEILRLAHELDHEEFLDRVDEIVHDYLVKFVRNAVADDRADRNTLVISKRTGRIRS
jgi:hypothetical protein